MLTSSAHQSRGRVHKAAGSKGLTFCSFVTNKEALRAYIVYCLRAFKCRSNGQRGERMDFRYSRSGTDEKKLSYTADAFGRLSPKRKAKKNGVTIWLVFGTVMETGTG